MTAHARSHSVTANRLLAALPASDYAALLPYLKPVQLTAGQTVYAGHAPITHCYFLEGALMSLMSCTEQGNSVAVAMVSNEGLIGGAVLLEENLLPYQAIAQVSGGALRIPVAKLQEWFTHHALLQKRLLRYAHALFTQVVQTAACNRFHVIEQRLTRWLLLAQARLNRNKLPFTQEALSQVLGTDRVSITRAAQKLKKAGLVDYSRGQTTILDTSGLISISCECYSVIQTEYDHFMNP